MARLPDNQRPQEIGEYHLHPQQPGRLPFALHDLRTYLAANGTAAGKPHIHSYHQIIWFTRGAGRHFVDLQAYEVIPGAVFFIARGQVHHFDAYANYEGILLHFNEEFLLRGEPGTDYLPAHGLSGAQRQRPYCIINPNTTQLLGTYRDLIAQELAHDEASGREDLLRAYLGAFLIQLHRARRDQPVATPVHRAAPDDGTRAKLMRFLRLVDADHAKGLPIAHYARAMGMSARSLSTLTARTLNQTPSQLVQERIILEAKRLLMHADHSVKEIGYRLGFNDPSYFVKYFTRHAGLSPTAFRKAHAAQG